MDNEHDHLSSSLPRSPKALHSPVHLRYSHIQDQSCLKDQYIFELQQRLKRICEDFNYNFQLVEERDSELRSFEQRLNAVSAMCKTKDAELLDLRKTMQTREDDYTAEIDFLRLRFEDAQKTIEALKSKETHSLQQEAELSLQIDSIQVTLHERVQDLMKTNTALEEERAQLLQRVAAEKERLEQHFELERSRLKELVEEHRQCAVAVKENDRKFREELSALQCVISSKEVQLDDAGRKAKQTEAERNELGRELQRVRKEGELSQVKARMVSEAEVAHLREQLRNMQEAVSISKSQKSTLEDVISSLEKQLDLERKERAKDRRTIRETQIKIDTDLTQSFDKSAQWQSIAETRSEEIAVLRVTSTQRTLLQAEEKARQFERELARTKRTGELEAGKQQEEMKRILALEAQVKALERDKARLAAELRNAKVTMVDAETQQLKTEVETLRREKAAADMALREMRIEADTRRDYQKPEYHSMSHSSFDLKRTSLSSVPPREVSLDTIPSRDTRYMAGLKQRLAVVKDELETKFHGRK